jgi:hypothetical protein
MLQPSMSYQESGVKWGDVTENIVVIILFSSSEIVSLCYVSSSNINVVNVKLIG